MARDEKPLPPEPYIPSESTSYSAMPLTDAGGPIPSTRIDELPVNSSIVSGKKYARVNVFESGDSGPIPHRLGEGHRFRNFSIFWDVVMGLVPITFIVIAFCALSLDNQPLSGFGHNMMEAQKLGPTIFPIVFAAIVGRCMMVIARWLAEKGNKLGTIELFAGSSSLFTAIERIWMLQSWSVIGVTIFILWGLSPLGGQSSLRLLSISPSSTLSSNPLRYLDLDIRFAEVIFGGSMETVKPEVSGLIQAALLTPPEIRASPLDAWGNVKIPYLERLEGYNSSNKGNAWLDVPDSSSIPYAALSGVIVAGQNQSLAIRRSQFMIESAYQTLDCPKWNPIQVPIDASGPPELLAKAIGPLQGTNWTSLNLSSNIILGVEERDQASSNPNLIFVKFNEMSMDPKNLRPSVIWTNCTVAKTYVEANVTCSTNRTSSCGVTQMRRAPGLPRLGQDPSVFPVKPGGVYNYSSDLSMLLSSFSEMALQIQFSPGMPGGNSFQAFLENPNGVIYQDMITKRYGFVSKPPYTDARLRDIPPEEFSQRLTQLWNTYVQMWWAPTFVAGGAPSNLSVYDRQTRNDSEWFSQINILAASDPSSNSSWIPFFSKNSTLDEVIAQPDVYVVDRAWLAVFLIISLLLEALAVAATWIKLRLRAPHILGAVSSLTRDNPYVHLPPGGTALEGLERSRMLRDMPIQIGDVRADEQIGHIALTSTLGDRIGSDKSRLYR